MPGVTDPARELVDLCRALAVPTQSPGDAHLASEFSVDAWSAEFFQINFYIIARIEEMKSLVEDLPLDEDTRNENVSYLNTIAQAFGPNGHRNTWAHSCQNYLTPATLGPIANLSGFIRPTIFYPKLSEEEQGEILELVDQLLVWLEEHQLADKDFIRQALIDGVKQFRFRLSHLQWIGWGYTIASLREVIGAYLALERGVVTDNPDTIAQAMLKAVGDFVTSVYEKTKVAKDITETGDFMLRVYGATALIGKGIPQIMGLLT